jgi:hypothetical protein
VREDRDGSPGGVGALTLRGVTPITSWMHASVLVGAFVETPANPGLRDAQLSVPLLVVNESDLQFRIAPGFTLPLGSTTAGLDYTMLATGSVDPTMDVDFAAGGTWLGMASASVRAPLYEGIDRIQSGVYARGDGRIARRIGGGAVHAGVSVAGQQTRGLSSPGFVELAAVAGGSIPLNERFGLNLNARVPLWTGDEPRPYFTAVSAALTTVIGRRRPKPEAAPEPDSHDHGGDDHGHQH